MTGDFAFGLTLGFFGCASLIFCSAFVGRAWRTWADEIEEAGR